MYVLNTFSSQKFQNTTQPNQLQWKKPDNKLLSGFLVRTHLRLQLL